MTKSIRLKFLFANKDGVILEQTTEMDTLVSEIKLALIASWPAGKIVLFLAPSHLCPTHHTQYEP